jgi:hypothetical protein
VLASLAPLTLYLYARATQVDQLKLERSKIAMVGDRSVRASEARASERRANNKKVGDLSPTTIPLARFREPV